MSATLAAVRDLLADGASQSLPLPPLRPVNAGPYPLRNALANMPEGDPAIRASIDEVQRRLRDADAELYASLPTPPAGYHWHSELTFESDDPQLDTLRDEVTMRITYRLRPDAGAVPRHD